MLGEKRRRACRIRDLFSGAYFVEKELSQNFYRSRARQYYFGSLFPASRIKYLSSLLSAGAFIFQLLPFAQMRENGHPYRHHHQRADPAERRGRYGAHPRRQQA